MESISLYIHIPFCQHKCDYCDFLSHVPSSIGEMEDYIYWLKEELKLYEEVLKNRSIQTIFLGGGTPSMVPTAKIVELLYFVQDSYPLHKNLEITMEANPESLLHSDLDSLKSAGVNRLSIGAQSADDEMLKSIGRIHNVKDIERAFELSRNSGFDNINLDFISSLPGETLDIARKNIELIEKLNPNHVSMYSLILEDETPLHRKLLRGEIELPTEDVDRERVHYYERSLEKLGYGQYEISNFTKEGKECLHNKVYWTLGEYIGIGTGAHTHLDRKRYWNVRSFQEYLEHLENNKLPLNDVEHLSDRDRRNEFMMLKIRMNEGVRLKEKVIGSDDSVEEYYSDAINKNIEKGNLELVDGRIVLTQKGRDLSNQVELDFFE